MPLEPGTKLGPYEILAPLGAGGMGEVYRSRDTRLDRIVAIKVLPAHLADRADLRERFEREARAVSSLNHPHICTLHDVGEQDGMYFLVMEYVEGETLADRLLRGPLPVDQALKYAVQIADALDKAHRQGVVHRDLKPGNIMLAKSGSKLLDFGLARLKQPGPTPAFTSASVLPTEKSGLTLQGTIIGTLQYMAPEQLEGKDADARTDIFAFGGVLYEMVTGRKAFEGKSQVSLIGAILEREPTPVSTLQPTAPAALDRVIRRSLAKDPDERWQTASDLTAQLKWIAEAESRVEASVPVAGTQPSTPRRHAAAGWIAAGVFFLVSIALGLALYVVSRSPAEAEAVRFLVPAPDKAVFENGVQNAIGAAAGSVSPDGRRLAFTARDASGRVLLWLRPLDALTAQPLPGTEGAGWPFWSPDNRWIAFFAQGKLKKIDISGGPPQVLCDAPNGRGGTWNNDGVIVFAPNNPSPLSRVSAAGGEAIAVTKLTPEQTSHRLPAYLPDGKHFIYRVTASVEENSGVYAGMLDSAETHLILRADSAVVYSPPGYLLFVRQGTLLAQPFDPEKLLLNGNPIRVAEQVAIDGNSRGFSVSDNGLLVYRIGPASNIVNVLLAWYDRSGKSVESVGMPAGYRGLDLAPDGKRLALHRHDATGGDVWLLESAQSPMTRLTFDATQDNSTPIWSPDGKRIAFSSLRNGKWGIYLKLADNSGNEELLVESDVPKSPMSWSLDDRFIVYYVGDPKTGADAWVLPLTGERKPFPILQTTFNESSPQISPDGKWIAYASNETGNRTEIYIRPFPNGPGKWQISTNGGWFPRWRRDGKELFYMGALNGGKIIVAEIRVAGTSIDRGAPREFFDSGYPSINHVPGYMPYVVSPDGQRFLIPRPESVAGEANASLTVVLNWTSMLPPK